MAASALILVTALFAGAPAAPQPVSFPTEDGGTVHADRYGEGDHWVVLVHGARFDKESWREQAEILAEAGFTALAIDLRGYGRSRAGSVSDPAEGYPLDVLAAVRYAREKGAKSVSMLGGSMGGWAAAQAAVDARPGAIDRLILLAHSPIDEPEKMQGRKLFVLARDDRSGTGPRLPAIQAQYEKAPEPKELLLLDGSAHAQHLFGTEQGGRLMDAILRFLSEP